MNKRVLLVILLIFSLSCNLAMAATSGGNKNGDANNTPTSASTLTALINEIKGAVQVKQPNQSDYAMASDGSTLQLQGLVKTGNDGRARLDLSSGTIVRVAPASTFALTDNQSAIDNSLATKLKLEVGKVWIVLRGGTLDIETPTGQAGVRGSYLSVAIDPNTRSTYVTCLEGTCSLQNPAGTLDLITGQTGLLPPSDPTTNTYSAPQLGAMTPQDFQDWKDNVPEAVSLIPATIPTVLTAAPTVAANVPCVITLSGAVSKTLSCTVQVAFSSADGTTGIKIVSDSQITGIATLPEVQFVAQIPGQIQPGTYDAGTQAASVFESVTDAWLRDTQDGTGASSVTFTSVDVSSTEAQGTLYEAHGTVTAMLVPQGTATGSVTVTITF